MREQAALDNGAGRPERAAETLLQVLDRLDLSRRRDTREALGLRVKVLITLGLSEFLLHGAAAARSRFAEAERLVGQLGDDDLRARLAYQRANVAGRVGDLAAAREGLEGALARPEAFSPRERCSVLLSRGMLALEMSEPAAALEAFTRAAETAREGGFGELEFMALHNEGYAAYLLGDLPRALATMAEASNEARGVSLAPAQLDRAHVLLEAGLLDEAIAVLENASAVLVEGQEQVSAELRLRLSRAHRLIGNLKRAAAAAEEAVDGFDGVGAVGWAAKAQLALLQVDLDRARRLVDPLAHGEAVPAAEPAPGLPALVEGVVATADELCARAGDLGDKVLCDAARVAAAEALLLGDRAIEARKRLDGVQSIGGSLSAELDLAAARAGVHVAAGEPGQARVALRRAARTLAAGQQGSASLDLRTAQAVHGVRLARLDLELALGGGSGAVLEALERWRGATDRLPSLGRPDDDGLAALTEQLRTTEALLRGAADPAEVAQLTERVDRLQQEIRARDWTLSSTASAGPTELLVRHGREALDRADRDLVWFFPVRGRLMGVGVVGGRARVKDLMSLDEASELAHRVRVDLRTAATRRLGLFAQAVWGSLRSSAERLDAAAIRPWGARRRGLVLVTCEEVSAVPWSLLPSLIGRPVSLASSLTSFARREQPGERLGGTRVHVSVGPLLQRASSEASAVSAAWDGGGADVSVSEPSTARGLVAAMAAGGVVHVAAHGTHQVQSPLFSSVHLHDGPVFAHELQAGGVRADHVVLSACEVGSATFRPGEEQLGLAAAMLSLGARSAVAAVAPVPDDVAADTMVRHHAALARGVPSDEALASAVESGDPIAAAFVHLGGRFTRR